MVDAIASALADRLNGDCHSAKIDRAALQRAMQKQGVLWHGMVTERCQHQFADVPVFVAAAQMQQMRAVIAAVERVVALPGWMGYLTPALSRVEREGSHGVFFGYDFHLNSDG